MSRTPQLTLAGPMTSTGRTAADWAETERTVVKALCSAGANRVTEVAIAADLFGDHRCRVVWAAVLARLEGGARSVWLDGAIVAQIAAGIGPGPARDMLEWVKGAPDEVDDAAVDALIRLLRDRSYCATAYHLAARIREAVEQGTTDAAMRAEQMVGELRDLTESRQSKHKEVKLESAADAFDRFLQEAAAAPVKPPVLFGIPAIDRWTRQTVGTMTVVGAPQHVGKSGILTSACLATARGGHGAALLSLEDSWPELAARMAAELANVNPDEARNAQPGFDTQEKLRKARVGLVGLRSLLHGVRLEDRSVDACRAGIREAKRKGCKLVGIDYAQVWRKPSWSGKNDTRRDWFDEALAVCLADCAERDMVLMLLSQVTKDKNRTGLISASDLRESSMLADSAATILTLTPKKRNGPDDPDRITALVDKAKGVRGGKGRIVHLVRDDAGVLMEDQMPAKPTGGDSDEWGAS